MSRDLLARIRNIAPRLLAVTLLTVSALLLHGEGAYAQDRHYGHHRERCLVVDTDVANDDLRAFAVLAPHRTLRAVVVTEGISSVLRGRTAIALFLASASSSSVAVIQGQSASSPPSYDWLPAARAAAERMNGFLLGAVPAAPSAAKLAPALATALRGCGKVDLLVLGPWSSFVEYGPALRPWLHRIVASGRPLAENNPDNFNCVYDQPACDRADQLLRNMRRVVWVDLPADGSSYPPTQAMVDRFSEIGMPGLLRAALNADPSQWQGTRLWDDAAALYLLAPEHFRASGAHFEPFLDEEALRNALVELINHKPND